MFSTEATSSGGPMQPPLPPGGQFEIIFSFDTTGSMSSVLDEVKGRLQHMIQRLQADISGIRIGVIAHGDYCDKDVFYLEQHLDLSMDVKQLCEFVENVEGTGGGDPEECYELILRMASRDFSWTPGSQRALVVIGDSLPHEADYDMNTENIDWRKELASLKEKGIKIYGVQVFENAEATPFFETMAEVTEGHHLKLSQFNNVCDFIMAICYMERGTEFLEGYEAEVRARDARKGLHEDLEGLFGTLKRGDSTRSNTSTSISGASALPLRSNVSSASSAVSLSRVAPLPTAMVSPLPSTPTTTGPSFTPRKRVKAVVLKQHQIKQLNPSATKREKVRETNFVLNKLKWSPWKLAYVQSAPNKTGRGWRKSRNAGLRRKHLFHKVKKDSIYEVAVQTKERGRRHVVMCKLCKANSKFDSEKWEQKLFGRPGLRKQIDSVVSKGCKVFVRRAVVVRLSKKSKQGLKVFRRMYDYAWSRHGNTNSRRDVKVGSVQISY